MTHFTAGTKLGMIMSCGPLEVACLSWGITKMGSLRLLDSPGEVKGVWLCKVGTLSLLITWGSKGGMVIYCPLEVRKGEYCGFGVLLLRPYEPWSV